MDSTLFQNDVEKNQHENALQALCDQFPEQSQSIRINYAEQLAQRLPQATIRSYLPIFISRDIERTINRQ